jgi:hypothetical protein
MGHKRPRPSFETPRKSSAPQDERGVWNEALFWPWLATTFHLPGNLLIRETFSRRTHDEFSPFL